MIYILIQYIYVGWNWNKEMEIQFGTLKSIHNFMCKITEEHEI